MADAADRIEWHREPPRRLLVFLRYAVAGLLGGFAMLAVLALLVSTAVALANGNYGTVAVVVLLVLVGGPFSALTLLVLADEMDLRSAARNQLRKNDLRPRWLFLAAVCWLVVLPLAAPVLPFLLFGLPFAFLGLYVLGTARHTTGAVSLAEETLWYGVGERTASSLSTLATVRAVEVGHHAVVRLGYADTTTDPRPTVIVLPVDAYRRARPALETLARRTRAADDGSERPPTPPLARALLATFGVAVLGVGGYLATRAGDLLALTFVPVALAGIVGLTFLVVAWRA